MNSFNSSFWRAVVLSFVVCLAAATGARADTAIETETAQIGKKGEANFSQAYEYESAKDGSSQGTLTQIEYGISDRAEILVEPFFYVRESPDDEPSEWGMGDLEITPSYMVVQEKGWVPAVLVATKVKVPTAAKRVGGTGNYDYYPYLIFGQHYGGWTFNANLGVNFSQPEDSNGYDRTTIWDLETEREILPNLTLFVEAYSAEENVTTGSTSLEYQFTKHFNAFVTYARTAEQSDIGRTGFNISFGGED